MDAPQVPIAVGTLTFGKNFQKSSLVTRKMYKKLTKSWTWLMTIIRMIKTRDFNYTDGQYLNY